MSFFGWALVFVGLSVIALGVVALISLRLWHATKVLGQEAVRVATSLSGLGTRRSTD